MAETGTIIQATNKDFSRIAAFLGGEAAFVHRHLDWRSTLEWLGTQPFLLLENEGLIQALLAAPEEPPGTSWLNCFAVRDQANLETSWNALFPDALKILRPRNVNIFAVGLEEWLTSLLLGNHFITKQTIVVLAWNHHIQGISAPEQDLLIRPMLENDLDEVAAVDRCSFERQWVHSPDALRLAFAQSQHTSVAEVNGKIVAYELTTASSYTAHLARLAVLPDYRHQAIARHLVVEMLRYFSSRGVLQLTVNTQSDNVASLHLYQRLGFKFTGEEYPVLQME
jgi:ribosomal protein S18 acetylase RimI-like enzyme